LLLDADRLAADDEPVGGGVAMPGRRRGLVSSEDDSVPEATGQSGGTAGTGGAASGGDAGAGSDAPAKAAPRVGGGATLFERMANLSRGGRSADDDDGDDDGGDGPSISIPRFLGRQNNQ
jgi:cell division protein FtsZ